MSFRFRRIFKLLPGVKVNFGKRGASLSVGVPGAHVNLGARGMRSTLGIPGTGLSWSRLHGVPKRSPRSRTALMRHMESVQLFALLDGEIVGPRSFYDFAVAIIEGSLPRDTPLRENPGEPWEPIPDDLLDDVRRDLAGIGDGTPTISRIFWTALLCVVAVGGVIIAVIGLSELLDFGNSAQDAPAHPSKPAPIPDATPATHAPTTAFATDALTTGARPAATPRTPTPEEARIARDVARARTEAAEIARKYSTK